MLVGNFLLHDYKIDIDIDIRYDIDIDYKILHD